MQVGNEYMIDLAFFDLESLQLILCVLAAIHQQLVWSVITNCAVWCLSCMDSAELFPRMVTAIIAMR